MGIDIFAVTVLVYNAPIIVIIKGQNEMTNVGKAS